MLSRPGMFDSPPDAVASDALPIDNCVQPTFNYALRVWWAYYWPTTLISFVIFSATIFFARRAYEELLISARVFLWGMRVLPYVVTYFVAIFVIRYILGKTFRHFRIALLPRTASAEPLPRTLQRTILVWWAFSWRTLVYSLIAMVAAQVTVGMFLGILSALGRVTAALAPLVAGTLIAGAVGMYVMYSNILGEEFGDFQVCLLPREVAAPSVSSVSPANRDVASGQAQ